MLEEVAETVQTNLDAFCFGVDDPRLERLDERRPKVGRWRHEHRHVRGLGERAPWSSDDALHRRARSRASSSALTTFTATPLTTFTATPCSREPPPTERRAVRPRGRAARSPARPGNVLSQPSSFVRAVSSGTLSVGA